MHLRKKAKQEFMVSLGWPKDSAGPTCPAKSKRTGNQANTDQIEAYAKEHPEHEWLYHSDGKLKFWYELKQRLGDIPGFVNHRARNHKGCEICTCRMLAGAGTSHPGRGYCYYHDREVTVKESIKVQNAQHQAMLKNNPFTYDHASEYLEQVRRNAEAAGPGIHLQDDLNVLRSFVAELLDKSRPEGDPRVAVALEKICRVMEGVKDTCGEDEEAAQVMGEALVGVSAVIETIRDRWAKGLTEKGKEGPQPMSDATMMKLTNDLMKSMDKLMGSQWKFDSTSFISKYNFDIWLAQIVDVIKMMAPGEDWFNELVIRLKEIKDPQTGV